LLHVVPNCAPAPRNHPVPQPPPDQPVFIVVPKEDHVAYKIHIAPPQPPPPQPPPPQPPQVQYATGQAPQAHQFHPVPQTPQETTILHDHEIEYVYINKDHHTAPTVHIVPPAPHQAPAFELDHQALP